MSAPRFQSPLRILTALMAALLMLMPAHAATVPDLYSADVDASLPRERQIQHALDQVLVKLSGRPAIVRQPEVEVLKDNAALLIENVETTAAGGERVRFEPQAMRRLMDNLGLPLLPDERPEVLVWLAQDTGDGAEFIEPGTTPYRVLAEGASVRGLPLRAPLLDLQDQMALTAGQLAVPELDAILAAASRYQFDAMLVGMRRGEQVDWILWRDGQQYPERSATDRQSLQQLIGRVADRLYGINTQPAGADAQAGNGQITYVPQQVEVGPFLPAGEELTIEGVAAAADYLAVTGALRQLPGVEAVVTAGQSAGALRLVVRVAPQASLPALLSQEPRLVPVAPQRYRWNAPLMQP